MKRIFLFFLTVSLTLSIFGGSATASATNKSQQDINDIKKYVENNVPLLQNSLSNLPKNSSLDKIEKTISNHFKEHPAPQAFNNPNLSLFDVFPEKKAEYEKFKGKTLNLNNFIESQEKQETLGEVISFNNSNSSVKVFLGELGDIQIVEQKTISKSNGSNDATIQLTTKTERTTGIAYGTTGTKLFTLWAEGKFSYDGKKVSTVAKDGDYKRHLSGTALLITVRNLGKDRDASHGGYAYREVYSRIYVETIIGFKWAGVVLNSANVEAYVGSTAKGSIYGGTKKS
ncbi:hypothetical protein [Bacillus atrophaeus]|uniref:hypothetical protein n=1 Tax=Bacillus atrophaeus TaxID=1452 RepID=UPI002281385E|nr:hypothetical protein [Bacillus atrophaeus]MCY8946219.1 hypothetical protein [Bacillus atrophaeus]MCY8952017.1 hypothetical protein [Bacillus atrophaeus]MCY9205971.1 hypothetical protein [Bacillus atrophaeus]MEC0886927.1 hypothetical protein [Bacillus atrophaeus]